MTNFNVKLKRFSSAHELEAQVASDIASQLELAIAARGQAGLLEPVSIALVDERWVEPSDPGSNERFLREMLLRDGAAAVHFLGLKNPAPSPDLGAAAAWNASACIPRPVDITVLGMGDDGHTASLFPGSPNLKGALDPETPEGYIGMWSASAPHARPSLILSALLDSRRILIFLLGEAKLRTYAAAYGLGPVEEMPVRVVLRQQRIPVEVVWAPAGPGL